MLANQSPARETTNMTSSSNPCIDSQTSPKLSERDGDNDTTMSSPTHSNKSSARMDVDNNSDDDNNHNKHNTKTSKSSSPATTIDSQQFDVEITNEDYESIAIMIDELMKDDPAVRIKAIRSLPIISKALGEERTRNELIPYITQMIDDDDEVLLVLIEEIYRLLTLKLIGGISQFENKYAYSLIPPFERLCQIEEKIIRDEATNKFGQILHNMPYKELTHYFDEYVLPLFKRICQSDWHTARISGTSLHPLSPHIKVRKCEKYPNRCYVDWQCIFKICHSPKGCTI